NDIDGSAASHEILRPPHPTVRRLLVRLAGVAGPMDHDDWIGPTIPGGRNLILNVHSLCRDVAGNRCSRGSRKCRANILLVDEKAPLLSKDERLIGVCASRGGRGFSSLSLNAGVERDHVRRSQSNNSPRRDSEPHCILLRFDAYWIIRRDGSP